MDWCLYNSDLRNERIMNHLFARLYTSIFSAELPLSVYKGVQYLQKTKLSGTNVLIESIDSNTYRLNIYSRFRFTLIESILILPCHFKVNLTRK